MFQASIIVILFPSVIFFISFSITLGFFSEIVGLLDVAWPYLENFPPATTGHKISPQTPQPPIILKKKNAFPLYLS